MSEPTTNPTRQTTSGAEPTTQSPAPGSAAPRVTGTRQLDHNDECVGCGAHFSKACTFDCFFETGILDAAVVLRTAAHRLVAHPDGGIDIRAAITAAVADLTTDPAQDQPVRAAHTVLGDYLEENATGTDATFSVRALVVALGRLCNRNQVAVTLYAAAARHDGIEFDPDAFGDFPA
jgi:hypothetical protein